MSNLPMKQLPLVCALALLPLPQGCTPAAKVEAQTAEPVKQVPVSVTPAQERTFEERLTAQGTLLARNYAMVAPRVDGILTDMFVEEGDRVEKDKTPLFQIDKVVLTQAYEIAQQDKAVAECARADGEAQVIAAQAQHDKMKLDYDRFTRLLEQKAITPDAMEQMEAGYTVAKAQLNRAKTAVRLYGEQEKKAVAAVEIAKKRLDDSLVLSPIDGFISYRGKKPGEFAGAGVPIIRVADTSVLEVSVFLPAESYPRLKAGETRLRATANGIELGLLPVSYKSPEIQDQLRTFEVKCVVETPPEGVAPGAMVQVETVLQTRAGVGVPQDVIQTRDGKKLVFIADGDAAKAVEVDTGLTTDGWTEILNGGMPASAKVIVKGYNLVSDGTPVKVIGEE